MKSALPVGILLFFLAGAMLLQGCLKDHCTKSLRYKVYTPHYISMAEARTSTGPEAAKALRTPGKIFYHHGYLFVGEPNQGIHILDDRDPSNPQNIGFLRIPGNLDMAISGDVLYADSYVDMVSFDVSDPSQVRLIARTEDIFAIHAYGYAFSDDPAHKGMITGFTVTDTTIEAACPVSESTGDVYYSNGQLYMNAANSTPPPSANGASQSQGGSTSRFAVQDHYLYAVNGDSMKLYDISRPARPAYLRGIPVGLAVETIFSYQHHLFIGSSNGIAIFDATHPEAPVHIGGFSHVLTCDPVVVQDQYAYATLRTGSLCRINGLTNKLLVIDISNLGSPKLLTEMELTNPGGLAVHRNDLIVTDGEGGIRFLDISDPENPRITSTRKGPQAASDVIMLDKIALVVAKDGLYQYNYENMEAPKLVSKLQTSGK